VKHRRAIEVTSTAFQQGTTIPKHYTGDGADQSPPLRWSEPPSGTKSIALYGGSMSATHVVVEGTVKPDGSLQLDSKLELPPGRVQLIVQPLPELPRKIHDRLSRCK